jgi:hypothetical protein
MRTVPLNGQFIFFQSHKKSLINIHILIFTGLVISFESVQAQESSSHMLWLSKKEH